ncbi:hypothetical protein PCH_Pc21g18340 [Penicillium rubens Wisconsin 54-1255]|uniref:Uncharacterized protein n=1 Tax=Penicillium rubens (strain ATCC 28089 / DSM 1075 / NRRL 1951 / Wisconsin 54-1255) TaxID=500485 RepID=B6HNW1_PENRW|nr:hypothetical protein PCH_Pc21g18340 [Penicillium rubens Wisconsin 54-1255]
MVVMRDGHRTIFCHPDALNASKRPQGNSSGMMVGAALALTSRRTLHSDIWFTTAECRDHASPGRGNISLIAKFRNQGRANDIAREVEIIVASSGPNPCIATFQQQKWEGCIWPLP